MIRFPGLWWLGPCTHVGCLLHRCGGDHECGSSDSLESVTIRDVFDKSMCTFLPRSGFRVEPALHDVVMERSRLPASQDEHRK
ncbi:hypothetical protein EDC04DRAFT_2691580 [Pisolithus marmoratus]|nr:hypothetical protein EDC04DRAFT_2691580 [Pisolithus marmoratus]